MAGTGLTDITAGTRQTIGRYFSVVSMVPSSLFVVYVYVLVRSGAWVHGPNWVAAMDALVRVGAGGAFVLIALGVALGVVVHPLQFGLVQLLEGYWGTNAVARKIRELRVRHHRKRADALEDKDVEGDHEAGRLLAQYPTDPALSCRLSLVMYCESTRFSPADNTN